jgi:hypothetical protein
MNIIALLGGLLVLAAGLQTYWGPGQGALSAAVKPLIGEALALINAPAFTYSASAAIVLSAVAMCLLFWDRRIRPARRELAAIADRLAAMPLAGPGGATPWPQLTAQIAAALASNRTLLAAWASHVRGDGRLGEGSFGDAAQIEAQRRERDENGLMAALPGYYTTVGLILTFVGLVVALYFAARGFRSGDIEEARQSIIQLLNASAFKFLTSVAALASALMISLVTRGLLSGLRQQAWAAAAAVDDALSRWRALAGAAPATADGNAELLEAIRRLSAEVSRLSVALGRVDDSARRGREIVASDD